MDNVYYTPRRGKMPTSHSEIAGGFKLFVKAHGVRNFCLLKYWPYFSGCHIRLQIGVDHPLSMPLKYEYQLARWDTNMRCANRNILGNTQDHWITGSIQSGIQDLFDHRLFINGKHTLLLKYEYDGRKSKEIVFFEFNLLDKDISM